MCLGGGGGAFLQSRFSHSKNIQRKSVDLPGVSNIKTMNSTLYSEQYYLQKSLKESHTW